MGHRLSKITTRTGDAGQTGLGDGSRVAKDSPRVQALGEVDELNCAIGLVLAEDVPQDVRETLLQVQHELFDLGGELSIPGHSLVKPESVAALEARLERWNADLPPLKEFALPGGSRAAAAAHLARAVCRRAERAVVALGGDATSGASDSRSGASESRSGASAAARQYLNRLSDLLFVAGRILNRHAGRPDVQWRHERGRG